MTPSSVVRALWGRISRSEPQRRVVNAVPSGWAGRVIHEVRKIRGRIVETIKPLSEAEAAEIDAGVAELHARLRAAA